MDEEHSFKGLTLYDRYRQPRLLVSFKRSASTSFDSSSFISFKSGSTLIHVATISATQNTDPNVLLEDVSAQRAEAKCVLCMDTVRSAVAATACLHRFCEDCIQRSLRIYSKKRHSDPHACCLCRAEIGSEQQLR
jgi:Zinc finger, C3HC4 type (RING finger)